MDDATKQKLSELAAELIAWVQKTSGEGEQFVKEQAPLVAQEIVNWQFWGSIATAVMLSLVIPVVVHIVAVIWDWLEDSDDAPFAQGWVGAIGGIACMFMLALILSCVSDAVKSCVAPRLVIIQELQRLL